MRVSHNGSRLTMSDVSEAIRAVREFKAYRIRDRDEPGGEIIRQTTQPHFAIERVECNPGRGDQTLVFGVLDRVAKIDPPRSHLPNPAAHPQWIVIVGGLPVANGNLADDQS